jgi:hypothetical protein
MKGEALVSQVVSVTLAVCLASLAMLAGCSCYRVKTDDVKKPAMTRPTEDVGTHKSRTGEATEDNLQAAEHKGYADGLRDGQE